MNQLFEGCADKGGVPCCQLVQDAAQGPEVGGEGVGGALLEQLGGHVARRASLGLHLSKDISNLCTLACACLLTCKVANRTMQQQAVLGKDLLSLARICCPWKWCNWLASSTILMEDHSLL